MIKLEMRLHIRKGNLMEGVNQEDMVTSHMQTLMVISCHLKNSLTSCFSDSNLKEEQDSVPSVSNSNADSNINIDKIKENK